MDDQYPVLHPQVATQVMDGQAVIVLPDSGRVTVLNEVGTRVWELIDGAHTVRQIAETLTREFDVSLATALQDTRDLIQRLVERRAVELKETPVQR